MTDYHPVTREELDMIKNDCFQPDKECEGCEYDGEVDCTFNAKTLIVEILERPDRLALLEEWRKYMPDKIHGNVWDEEYKIIKQLRTNPEAMREQGLREGWWIK